MFFSILIKHTSKSNEKEEGNNKNRYWMEKHAFMGLDGKRFSVLFINSYVAFTQTHPYTNLKPSRHDFHHTYVSVTERKFPLN